jgi:uncharacterized glyoxalase superfamily protein PhnB
MTASWLPDGVHTLTPNIIAEDAARAVRAGAAAITPMTDMFFGIREGRVSDPFGNLWIIATLTQRLSPEEMQRRLQAEGY